MGHRRERAPPRLLSAALLAAGPRPPDFDGTLRVQRDGDDTIASGDLYIHRPPRRDPAAGIPIFPINAHRYYVRVTQILEGDAEARRFTLGYELLRKGDGWSVTGRFTARMQWIQDQDDVLRGKVRDAHGAVVGSLTMGWVSPYLRRATVEIDRIPEAELPLHRGDGLGWRDVFDQIGWDLDVVESDADITEASGESWSNTELHAAMLERREKVDLDREWRYWLLCVRRLDAFGADRGIMFDLAGGGSNSVPREGAAVASTGWSPTTSCGARSAGRGSGRPISTSARPSTRSATHWDSITTTGSSG